MIALHENTSAQYKHFNQQRICSYLSKDEQKEILPIAIAEIGRSLEKLEACKEAQHLNAIQEIAHHLAGTTSQMGLEEMTEMARSLENLRVFEMDLFSSYLLKLKLEAKLINRLVCNYLENVC